MDSEARVLVVDDSEANRDMLSRRLRRRGFTVTAASGGREALELIAGNRYDVVLLDLVMPDIGGLEVLKTLRETWSATELPVIIATAKDESTGPRRLGSNEDAQERRRNAGHSDHRLDRARDGRRSREGDGRRL